MMPVFQMLSENKRRKMMFPVCNYAREDEEGILLCGVMSYHTEHAGLEETCPGGLGKVFIIYDITSTSTFQFSFVGGE